MKHLRVLLAVLLATGGVAACGGKDPAPPASGSQGAASSAASPSSAPAPKDQLLAAAKALDSTSYNFTLKQTTMSGNGRVDPANKAGEIEVGGKVQGQSIALSYTVVGGEVYVKADFGAALNQHFGINKTKWMLIDQSKIKDKSSLPVDASGDVSLGTEDALKGISDVKQTDSTHLSGTIDVTAADSMLSPDQDVVTKVGDKAKAVPFTATLDDQGRLVELKVDGASIDPALTVDVTFSDFGAIKPITKPVGAIPAPAAAYTFLNG